MMLMILAMLVPVLPLIRACSAVVVRTRALLRCRLSSWENDRFNVGGDEAAARNRSMTSSGQGQQMSKSVGTQLSGR